MSEPKSRHGWHPFDDETLVVDFPAYLTQCTDLAADALHWASTLPPDEDPHLLLGQIAIRSDNLRKLPPMPEWMRRIFGNPAPAVFGSAGSEQYFYQWPFSWLYFSRYDPRRVGDFTPGLDMVERWEAASTAWRLAHPVSDWLSGDGSARHALSDAAERLASTAKWTVPKQGWRDKVRAAALQDDDLQQIFAWTRSLGDREALEGCAAAWPQIGTYWSLLRDFEDTAALPGDRPLSAVQRAALNTPDGCAPLGLDALDGPQLAGPVGGGQGQIRARALRQFTYWGKRPIVPKNGLRHPFDWPSDPRLLSEENEDRAVAAIWIIRLIAPPASAIEHLSLAASTLSLQLFNAKVNGARERSWRATKAAIHALDELGAADRIEALAPLLKDPRLRKSAAQLIGRQGSRIMPAATPLSA